MRLIFIVAIADVIARADVSSDTASVGAHGETPRQRETWPTRSIRSSPLRQPLSRNGWPRNQKTERLDAELARSPRLNSVAPLHPGKYSKYRRRSSLSWCMPRDGNFGQFDTRVSSVRIERRGSGRIAGKSETRSITKARTALPWHRARRTAVPVRSGGWRTW